MASQKLLLQYFKHNSWHVVFKDVETLSAILLLYWGASTFLRLHLLYFALPSSLDGNSIHGSVNVLITFNNDGKKKTIQFHSQIGVNYFWIQIFWLRTAATLTLPVSDIYFTQDRVSILTLNFKSTRPVRRRLWMASRAEADPRIAAWYLETIIKDEWTSASVRNKTPR